MAVKEFIKNINPNPEWSIKSAYIISVFAVSGMLAGLFYRYHLNAHSIEDLSKLIGNPTERATEYGFSIFCAFIVLGICTAIVERFRPGASKRASDLFWEELGNMWRVTAASTTGFCCATLSIFLNRSDVTRPEDIASVHGLVSQTVWVLPLSIFVCFLPPIIPSEKNSPTIPTTGEDNNSDAGEK